MRLLMFFCVFIATSIDIYLDIVQGDSGVIVYRKGPDDTRPKIVRDLTTIDHAQDRIKPSTEKNLMVVVGSEPQHIGKLVRRVSNFYRDSKSDDNHWIVVVVITRTSPTAVENMTPERLELDPKTMLARVYESRKRRKEADEYMKLTRRAALASNRRMVPVRPLR
ncbi:hypothetical protein AAF712_001170 [Marasmius tenuissimus]|uniref:Uncharacterized protein n=1 Tax=Marasmius tenuissimus TaxID=585030 RepID=A0ABR3AD99_9AGAR